MHICVPKPAVPCHTQCVSTGLIFLSDILLFAGHEDVFGTAPYSSPEAVGAFDAEADNIVTGKADIYSLACCFVEVLSGSLVFKEAGEGHRDPDELQAAMCARYQQMVSLKMILTVKCSTPSVFAETL